MDRRYDILKLISQREVSEMSAENADLVSVASIFGNAEGNGGENETKPCESSNNVTDIEFYHFPNRANVNYRTQSRRV